MLVSSPLKWLPIFGITTLWHGPTFPFIGLLFIGKLCQLRPGKSRVWGILGIPSNSSHGSILFSNFFLKSSFTYPKWPVSKLQEFPWRAFCIAVSYYGFLFVSLFVLKHFKQIGRMLSRSHHSPHIFNNNDLILDLIQATIAHDSLIGGPCKFYLEGYIRNINKYLVWHP